jgi:cytochrome subunit of sulfide dehydrogenase
MALSIRCGVAFTLAAAFVVPGAALAQDATRAQSLAATCANCHGTEGRSVGVTPSLAGMDAGVMYLQLTEFRDGKRPATIMHQIARGYTDAQLKAIAGHFAAQPKTASR